MGLTKKSLLGALGHHDLIGHRSPKMNTIQATFSYDRRIWTLETQESCHLTRQGKNLEKPCFRTLPFGSPDLLPHFSHQLSDLANYVDHVNGSQDSSWTRFSQQEALVLDWSKREKCIQCIYFPGSFPVNCLSYRHWSSLVSLLYITLFPSSFRLTTLSPIIPINYCYILPKLF